MAKKVGFPLKEYMPDVFSMYKPQVKSRVLTVGAVVRPIATELWEKKNDTFIKLMSSIDVSTSPNGWVSADKVDAARFVVEWAKKNNRLMPDFPIAAVHRILVIWGKQNGVSRRAIEAAAKVKALAEVKAAE